MAKIGLDLLSTFSLPMEPLWAPSCGTNLCRFGVFMSQKRNAMCTICNLHVSTHSWNPSFLAMCHR